MIHQFEQLGLDQKQIRYLVPLDRGKRIARVEPVVQHNPARPEKRNVQQYLRKIRERAVNQLNAIARARNTDALRHGCAYVAETLPSIPGEAFWLCIFVEHRSLEVALTALSLSFGAFKLSQI